HESVLRNSKHSSLDSFDSKNSIRQATNVYLAADRVAAGKKFRGNVRADVGHARRTIGLGVGKETAVFDIAILNVGRVGGRADHKHIVKNLIVSLDLRGSAARFRAQLRD